MRENDAPVKKYKNYFLKQEIDYLTNFKYKTSNFYGLPTFHV